MGLQSRLGTQVFSGLTSPTGISRSSRSWLPSTRAWLLRGAQHSSGCSFPLGACLGRDLWHESG